MGKVKIFDFTTLKLQLENIICEETRKVLKSYPEIFTEKYEDMFKVIFTRSSIMFIEDELFNSERKAFSRKFIVNKYNDGVMERNTKPMIARMLANTDKKGVLHIRGLEIKVNVDILVESALFYMWDIDNWIEKVLKTDARHEAGHIIDFIKSYDGKKATILKKDNERMAKALTEWREWCNAVSDNGARRLTDDEERERFERYFRVPGESTADMYGKVNRKECLEYQIKSHHYNVNVVIRTHARKREEPKEGDNKNEQG